MSAESEYLRGIISSMIPQEIAAAEEARNRTTWSDADVTGIFENKEAERIAQGESDWMSPAERAEVERLADPNL